MQTLQHIPVPHYVPRNNIPLQTDLCITMHNDFILKMIKNSLTTSIEKDSTILPELVTTTGKVCSHILSTLHNVIRFHCDIIEKAETEVLFTTSYWEGKSLSAYMLSRSFQKLLKKKPNVKIRIVVDNGTIENLFAKGNTRLIKVSKLVTYDDGGTYESDIMNIRSKSVHVPLFGTMHAKFMLVDRKIGVVSSNNVQDRPNVELAVSMEGKVCDGIFDIFRRLWKDDDDLNVANAPTTNASLATDIIFANRRCFGGFSLDIDSPQNCAWWTLMSCANNDIFITTPTFNAGHAMEAVYLACRRGIRVTMVLTKNFNDKKEAMPFQGGTNNHSVKRLKKRLQKVDCGNNLLVRWYVGKNEKRPKRGVHSHVKFLSIDHSILMFGNGNMDTQSWYHSMEVNIIIPSSDLCKELEGTMMKYSILSV